jgi:phenylpropionate dioxygenase-like ring-hydroxylating dioxygenase large terminal subunit
MRGVTARAVLAPPLLALAERLMTHVRAGTLDLSPASTTLPVDRYGSRERLGREQATLFRRYPIAIAAASELATPGTCLRHDALGLPLVLLADETGEPHCFLNVCRHRGMRLVADDAPCRRKALVCPYHGWTYGLDGALRHVPHAEAFPGLDAGAHGLVALPLERRHGLLWVHPTPGATLALADFLGSLDDDLASFDLAHHVLYRRVDTVRRANWKLVIDAFLEAYHLRVLHKDTIYRFFLDAAAVSDFVGPHVRSVTARRAVAAGEHDGVDLRELFTFTHFVFPNSVFIFHPDYVSHVTVFPVDVDQVRWVHSMLVQEALAGPEHAPHWDRTLALIEETVFQREDLVAAEGIQAGVAAGANTTVLFGRLEGALHHFHAAVERALRDQSPRLRTNTPKSPPHTVDEDPPTVEDGRGAPGAV